MFEKKPIQSAGWIIYYIDRDGKPRFLLIKRFALSKKVERVAPKGKIQWTERAEETAMREICEETWIKRDDILMKQWVWDIVLSLHSQERWNLDKEISYFLVQYIWNPKSVNIWAYEWYLWQYKWATIEEVLRLVIYQNLREVFKAWYDIVCKKNVKKK
mgnify:CR=1 FL=1